MAKPTVKTDPIHEKQISTSELSALLGKSAQWIRQLTRENVLEQVSRGKFILGDVIRAYIKHIEGESSDGKVNYRDEKAEHERIKKEMAQLELEEMRKNLHTTTDVQEAWSDLIVEFRKRLTGFPTKLASRLAYMDNEKKIREFMNEEINTALLLLSQYDPMKAGDSEGEETEEADT